MQFRARGCHKVLLGSKVPIWNRCLNEPKPTSAMKNVQTIITHPGGAHRDDFRAVAIAMALFPNATVHRRNPTEEELEDPTVLILDVGGRHEPERLNFDHHQFPRDHEPVCALTLLLQHLGLYEVAQATWPWLRATEVLDSKGPLALAKEFGLTQEASAAFIEPETGFMVSEFGAGRSDAALMVAYGKHLLAELKDTKERHALLSVQAEAYYVGGNLVLDTRAIAGSDRPAFAVESWLKSHGHDPSVVVSNDDRGEGVSLYRRNDAPGVDFSRLAGDPRVVFAHVGGFIAKTKAGLTEEDLLELLAMATATAPEPALV